jgi:RNA polymerase sigma-70 factor (ECF subfamily)
MLGARGITIRASMDSDVYFQQHMESHRYQLQVHCYRMLGSLFEAEDAVQETFLRAWRARERFEGRASLRNWLYRIATNVCLNLIAARSSTSRVLPDTFGAPSEGPLEGEPASDIAWLEPYPDAMLPDIVDAEPGPDARYEMRESVQLAFIAAIQQLPARQRAALLLRDVLGFSAAETAQLLESSVVSVNSAVQRARASLEHGAADPRALPPAEGDLADRFLATWEASDIDGFVALLKEDAVLRMPPWRQWYRGREAIRTFFGSMRQPPPIGTSRVLLTRANAQPAFAHYQLGVHGAEHRAHTLQVATIEAGKIAVLTAFVRNVSLFAKFDLPLTLPLSPS